MEDNNIIRDQLEVRFKELSEKYHSALKKDLEFNEVKCIYVELKEIKQKLSSLEKGVAGSRSSVNNS